MKFEIKRHKNGYVIKAEDEDEGIVYEESEDDEEEMDGWARFLYTLTEHYGPSTSRYSPKRLHIKVYPGDKWDPPEGEKYEDYFCKKCGNYKKE